MGSGAFHMDDGWLHLKHGEHFGSQVRIVPGLVPFSHHASIIRCFERAAKTV